MIGGSLEGIFSQQHRGSIDLERVLLATDGSEDAAVAARAAIDLCNLSGSELHVVHVFEFIPPREYVSVAIRARSPFASSHKGTEILNEQISLVERAGGVVHQAHLRMGSPVNEILITAQDIGASLVVVGSRGLGGVKRLLMGSVSERVVSYAACPVLVLRSREATWPPSRVIIADDGSEYALGAGKFGALIGGLFGAEATLAQVYPRALESQRADGGAVARLVDSELRRAERLLVERSDTLAPALGKRPSVQLIADEGSETIDGIAMTLLDVAEAAGEPTLLIVGSRGLGAVERIRLGSVSTKVTRASDMPVLVYPYGRVGDVQR